MNERDDTPSRSAGPARAASSRGMDEPIPVRPEIFDALPAFIPEARLLVGLITAAIIIAGLYFGRDIVVPLVLALLLGFVLDPFVSRLKRLGLSRTPTHRDRGRNGAAIIIARRRALAPEGMTPVLPFPRSPDVPRATAPSQLHATEPVNPAPWPAPAQ